MVGECRLTAGRLNASCAPVADRHFSLLINHRHLALAPGALQHFIHLLRVGLHVDVIMIRKGLPGLLGIRSTGFAVNRDARAHNASLN